MHKNKSMTWFIFLINFLLFASAALFIHNACCFFFGTLHGEHERLFYWLHPSLKIIDKITGVLFILLAAFAIYTRFQLAKHSAIAPKLLMGVYLAVAEINLIYFIIALCIIGTDYNLSSFILFLVPLIVLPLILVVINKKYIDNRVEMFIN